MRLRYLLYGDPDGDHWPAVKDGGNQLLVDLIATCPSLVGLRHRRELYSRVTEAELPVLDLDILDVNMSTPLRLRKTGPATNVRSLGLRGMSFKASEAPGSERVQAMIDDDERKLELLLGRLTGVRSLKLVVRLPSKTNTIHGTSLPETHDLSASDTLPRHLLDLQTVSLEFAMPLVQPGQQACHLVSTNTKAVTELRRSICPFVSFARMDS